MSEDTLERLQAAADGIQDLSKGELVVAISMFQSQQEEIERLREQIRRMTIGEIEYPPAPAGEEG